jgi:hypothetical protein
VTLFLAPYVRRKERIITQRRYRRLLVLLFVSRGMKVGREGPIGYLDYFSKGRTSSEDGTMCYRIFCHIEYPQRDISIAASSIQLPIPISSSNFLPLAIMSPLCDSMSRLTPLVPPFETRPTSRNCAVISSSPTFPFACLVRQSYASASDSQACVRWRVSSNCRSLHVVQFGFFVLEMRTRTGDSKVDELWNNSGSPVGREDDEHFTMSSAFPLLWWLSAFIGACEGFALVLAEIEDDWAVEWPPTEQLLSRYPQPCVAAVDDILAREYTDVYWASVFGPRTAFGAPALRRPEETLIDVERVNRNSLLPS